jgi:hypothetical protein
MKAKTTALPILFLPFYPTLTGSTLKNRFPGQRKYPAKFYGYVYFFHAQARRYLLIFPSSVGMLAALSFNLWGQSPHKPTEPEKVSILSQIPKFMRKCPLCDFQECKERQCMFFIGLDDKDYECLFYQIHANTFAAQAYSLRAATQTNMLVQTDPSYWPSEVVKEHLDRIEETLHSLDATTSLPLLEPSLRRRMQTATGYLSEYADRLRGVSTVSGQSRSRKNGGQKKD